MIRFVDTEALERIGSVSKILPRTCARDMLQDSSRFSGSVSQDRGNPDTPRYFFSLLFTRDRVVVFFLALLVLTILVLPTISLSQAGQLALDLVFVLTLIFGAIATIQRRSLIYMVI